MSGALHSKGQATVFILLGCLLLVLAAVGYILPTLRPFALAEPARAVQQYTQDCLESTLTEALQYIGDHGGYYEPAPYRHDRYRATYYLMHDRISVPETPFVQSQLKRFVTERIPFCLKNYVVLANIGTVDIRSQPVVEITLQDERVLARLDLPLRVRWEDGQAELQEFATEIDVGLGRLLKASNAFVFTQRADPTRLCITCLKKLVTTYEAFIDISNAGKGEFLLALRDRKHRLQGEPFSLVFATKHPVKGTYTPMLSIDAVPEQQAVVGETLELRLTGVGEGLEFLTLDPRIVVGPEGQFRYVPEADHIGVQTFTVLATDAAGDLELLPIQVTVTGPDQSPVFESVPELSVSVGEPFVYELQAQDPEGGPLTFMSTLAFIHITPEGVLSFIPTKNEVGFHEFTVIAKDIEGNTARQKVLLLVREFPAAPPPVEFPLPAPRNAEELLAVSAPTLAQFAALTPDEQQSYLTQRWNVGFAAHYLGAQTELEPTDMVLAAQFFEEAPERAVEYPQLVQMYLSNEGLNIDIERGVWFNGNILRTTTATIENILQHTPVVRIHIDGDGQLFLQVLQSGIPVGREYRVAGAVRTKPDHIAITGSLDNRVFEGEIQNFAKDKLGVRIIKYDGLQFDRLTEAGLFLAADGRPTLQLSDATIRVVQPNSDVIIVAKNVRIPVNGGTTIDGAIHALQGGWRTLDKELVIDNRYHLRGFAELRFGAIPAALPENAFVIDLYRKQIAIAQSIAGSGADTVETRLEAAPQTAPETKQPPATNATAAPAAPPAPPPMLRFSFDEDVDEFDFFELLVTDGQARLTLEPTLTVGVQRITGPPLLETEGTDMIIRNDWAAIKITEQELMVDELDLASPRPFLASVPMIIKHPVFGQILVDRFNRFFLTDESTVIDRNGKDLLRVSDGVVVSPFSVVDRVEMGFLRLNTKSIDDANYLKRVIKNRYGIDLEARPLTQEEAAYFQRIKYISLALPGEPLPEEQLRLIERLFQHIPAIERGAVPTDKIVLAQWQGFQTGAAPDRKIYLKTGFYGPHVGHELFHNYELSGIAKFPNWDSLNEPDFSYLGYANYYKRMADFPKEPKGFSINYGMSTGEEDRATVYDAIFNQPERLRNRIIQQKDKVLLRKVHVIIDGLNKATAGNYGRLHEQFNDAYWTAADREVGR